MGMGDELMALGEAQARHRRTGKRVVILDRNGKPRTHSLWRGNEWLCSVCEPSAEIIVNGPGHRPYIESYTSERWSFRPYRPIPASLPWVVPDLRGEGRIIIEPSIKANASPNKQWGRWKELIFASPDLPWAQIGGTGTSWLPGVEKIETSSFEQALGVLAAARLAVLPEGGLHHGAAAVGCKAVVLFGGFISPQVTGYLEHINLGRHNAEAQGWRILHPACEAAWCEITVDLVLKAVKETLGE